ncbi:LicD family-domain-containing protein [Xylaria sp. FL0064]|nr:LicD family-domain-containing protein [Xylaria sp. FL0064]
MRVLHTLLFFALAISAAPVIVTEVEIATVVAPANNAEATPDSTTIANIKDQNNEVKLQESPEKPITSPPKDEKKQDQSKEEKPKAQNAKGKKPKDKDNKPKEQKYFHEPGWDLESGHYDARYFHGKVPYEQHRPALRHLIRSYLTTFRALGVETWLAHGSLLGWWWNGKIMPWDYDLDVQVSVATLSFLGERYNRSTHEYEYEIDEDEDQGAHFILDYNTSPPTAIATTLSLDNGTDTDDSSSGGEDRGEENATTTVKKTYLLDINPHHGALTKGNGANIIDARWIDTSNGMFIDITGLRERDIERSPGIWSCKNNHRYRTAELWPLRRTEFEGVEAWIPYAFDKVLTDEYGPKSLVTEEWAGLVFPFFTLFMFLLSPSCSQSLNFHTTFLYLLYPPIFSAIEMQELPQRSQTKLTEYLAENRHRWIPELREWVKLPKKNKPAPPASTSKKVEGQSTDNRKDDKKDDNKDAESVVVYEEVIVQV